MSTVPYVYTDLFSPSSLRNSVDSAFQESQVAGEKKSVIPVRTWSRGSPFKPGKQNNNKGQKVVEDSIGTFDDGGLADYLANMTMIENTDENVDHPGIGKDPNHSGLNMTDDQFHSFMMPPDEEMDGPSNVDGQYSQAFHGEESDDQDEYASYANDYGSFAEGQDSVVYGMGQGEVEDDDEEEYEEEEYEEEGDEVDEEEGDDEDGEEEEEGEEENDDDEEEGGGEGGATSGKLHAFESFEDMFENPAKFMTSYQSLYKQGHLMDPKRTSPTHVGADDGEEQGDDEEESFKSIMNDYTELLSYMDSPRADNKKALKDNLNFIMNNGNIINLHDGSGKKKSKKPSALGYVGGDSRAVLDDNNFLEQQDYIAIPKKKKKSSNDKKKSKKNSNFDIEIEYGPNGRMIQKKKPKKSKQTASNNAAAMRHRAMLQDMVEKRRREEEELQLMAQQAQEKRKKFRDALLEKAMKARKEQQNEEEFEEERHVELPPKKAQKQKANNDHPPAAAVVTKPLPASSSLLQPTAAYKNQSINKPQHEEISEEEARRLEEEKREYIASIRRKFKDQHKMILAQLAAKKKEQQDKSEQEQMLEAKRRERRKKKLEQMLAGRDHATQHHGDAMRHDDGGDDDDDVDHETERRTKSASVTHQDQKKIHSSPSAAAVGSGLAVVRQRSSVSQPVKTEEGQSNSGKKLPRRQVAVHPEKDISDEDGDQSGDCSNDEHDRKAGSKDDSNLAKKQKAKQNNAKLAEYLSTLADSKKKEENDKKKKEERQRRRMILLSQRLLQEAAERKMMTMEDHPRHRELPGSNKDKDNDDKANNKPVKKITPEMAEAIANRLRTKQQQQQNGSEPSNALPTAPTQAKSNAPRPPRPSVERTNSTVATSSATNSNNNNNNSENTTSAKDSGPSASITASTASTTVVPARDYADWKRKNGVPPDAKVFCMTGWYPCVKQALLDRGWYFNSDSSSTFFHLKWTLRSIDVCQETLLPWQLTNHYLKNVAITTKAGLIKSLQNVVWLADVDHHDIIPRAYDLSINHDMRAFLDDFRCQKAEGILKKLYLQVTGKEYAIDPLLSGSMTSPRGLASKGGSRATSSRALSRHGQPSSTSSLITDYDASVVHGAEEVIPPTPSIKENVNLDEIKINPMIFEAVCHLIESVLRPYDEEFLDDSKMRSSSATVNGSSPSVLFATLDQCLQSTGKTISDLDWELVSNYTIFQSVSSLPFDLPEAIDHFLKGKEDEYQELTTGTGKANMSNTTSAYQQQQMQQQQIREKKRYQKLFEEIREEVSQNMRKLRSLTIQDVERIHRLLSKLHYYYGNQAGVNGKASVTQNIWIVKPAAKSRGRGITTFNDLPKLLKYVEAGSGLSTSCQWIVQKYMENPLIIAKRKFDLRQWVLVTDWNPLTIYFYNECYARFSVEEYTIESNELDNVYVHLVNNSIGKNSENFHKVVVAENNEPIEGYMWSYEQFVKYIQYMNNGEDIVNNKIQPRMKEIAKYSLMCASEMIEHRKNSWELYGFDYMIDDEYNAWLIEINSSPACDYSTKTTERYIQKALVELLNVVLDIREWDNQPKKTRGEKPSTGDWECIYQGPLLDMPAGSFGTEMTLKGEGIKTKNVNNNGGSSNVGGPMRSFAPQTTLSMNDSNNNNANNGNSMPPVMQGQGLGNSKRPTAGGVSYTPSGTNGGPSSANNNSVKRNAPMMKREDSTSLRKVAAGVSAPMTNDSNMSDSDGGGQGFSVSSVKISPPKTFNSDGSGGSGPVSGSGSAHKNDNSNNFDDSDEENGGSTKKAPPRQQSATKRGMSAKTLNFDERVSSDEGIQQPGAPVATNSARRDSANSKPVSGKPTAKPAVAPPVAQAIPVKVFSVDF